MPEQDLNTPVNRYSYITPLGTAIISEHKGYITAISITDDEPTDNDIPGPATLLAIQQLNEYFKGERLIFDLPLKPEGTAFQQEVWRQLQTIEYGNTISYAQQSQQMNTPLAIRAIAAANGKNKLWVVIPCHRVIGSNGHLTGYAGGIWRKKWLLAHEAKVMGIGQISMDL